MNEQTFEEQVKQALDTLPPQIAKALENVAVVVADKDPSDPDLYGVWESHPYLPDKITIFRGPLERLYGADPERLRREVKRVVLHEVAHHFGISDQRLVELDRY